MYGRPYVCVRQNQPALLLPQVDGQRSVGGTVPSSRGNMLRETVRIGHSHTPLLRGGGSISCARCAQKD